MEQLQINELINLIADLASIPIIFIVFRDKDITRYYFFLMALFLIILSHTFTLVESFIFESFFNVLEHLSILLAGIFFILGVYRYFIAQKDLNERH